MSPFIATQSWQDEIADVARGNMRGRVCFFEEIPPTDKYDPVTGEGGATGIRILWAGKARVQQIYNPRKYQTVYESNGLQRYRFQLDPLDNPPSLPYDCLSRVLNGARDPELENYLYTVQSAINSQDMAVRTIEADASLKPHEWSWSLDDSGEVIYE